MFGHCTDQSVQVHNSTSFPIRPDQPCSGYAGEVYWWGLVGVELPARIKGISGTLPTMLRQLVKICTEHMHVHTVYIHVHTLYISTMYCMHIPQLWLPPHTRLYSLWHRYIKCYHTGIYNCVHTGINLLYTPSGWLLRQLIKTCTYIAYMCTYHVYTCTYTVHGYHILYTHTTTVVATAYLPVPPLT